MAGAFHRILTQLLTEVIKMDIFLVIKQSISGWSNEPVKAFENISDAKSFILNEKRLLQFEYKIQKVTLISAQHS